MPPPARPSPKHFSDDEIRSTATELRIDILKMLTKAGSGHPGGSLSALDIILTLYSGEMHYSAEDPKWPLRDRFVLSKGHGVPALYAVMAARGFFDKSDLMTLRELGSPLQGHPANALLPGIEASTGSLGQGLSVAQGIALAARLKAGDKNLPQSKTTDGDTAWNVYCVLGDGEIQEGQIWEAAMSAPHLGINNLCAIVDLNKGQIDGLVSDVMPLEPLRQKWEAFGWHVEEIDGHDVADIRRGLDAARAETSRPTVLLAQTIKGKGVSFMESDTVGWHGKTPSAEELDRALAELEGGAK